MTQPKAVPKTREFEFSGQMVQTEGERLRAAIDKLTQKRG